MAVIQWLIAAIILLRYEFSSRNFLLSLLFMAGGIGCFVLFMIISARIRRVAVGKNKVVVIRGDRNIRFDWPEIKSVRIVPFFNLYKLRIRGRKKPIYFFPSRNMDPAFSSLGRRTSGTPDLTGKRKKVLRIR